MCRCTITLTDLKMATIYGGKQIHTSSWGCYIWPSSKFRPCSICVTSSSFSDLNFVILKVSWDRRRKWWRALISSLTYLSVFAPILLFLFFVYTQVCPCFEPTPKNVMFSIHSKQISQFSNMITFNMGLIQFPLCSDLTDDNCFWTPAPNFARVRNKPASRVRESRLKPAPRPEAHGRSPRTKDWWAEFSWSTWAVSS